MESTKAHHSLEVSNKERFEFGENWKRFLQTLDDTKIAEAKKALIKLLEVDSLEGKTFLDVGSGSGLMSLVARYLGAKVYSFDYDPQSVNCTQELKNRYFPNDENWHIEAGSALDEDYLKALGQFDVVYSWGVLHHTGQMWKAIGNVHHCTKPNGIFAIALYNDQGAASRRWWRVKSIYNKLPASLKKPYVMLFMLANESMWLLKSIIKLRFIKHLKNLQNYQQNRGMGVWYDWVDWVGGFPFEVAKPEEVLKFMRERGYTLTNLTTVAGAWGCNEFVFHRKAE